MKKFFLITFIFLNIFSEVFAENYQIIVDAGSSGCKLHLFHYETTQAMPFIKEIFYEKNYIPLSSFDKNPKNAGLSLEKLFNDVQDELKNKKIDPHKVEVHILATAGMRLIPEDKQLAIYENLKNFLQDHYSFQIGKIQTITGKMEGLYAWLDINYLANTFQNHTRSFGIIDMGGASTQIAFETLDEKSTNDFSTLKINGEIYSVFSKSFLGLGENQARLQMNKLPNSASCYPIGYKVGQTNGAWDFTECKGEFSEVIDAHNVVPQMISTIHQTFYAFSGAYYTYQFFQTDKVKDEVSLEKRIQTVCTKSWDELKKEHPNVEDQYLSSYCANAVYMDDLFYKSYQIKVDQLNVVNQINNQNLDWTLGAMLYELIPIRLSSSLQSF
jgi:Golgi nucleoside diphosphatase